MLFIGKFDGFAVMDLRQLATFRLVAATRNFTRAASTLNYAQSSVTAQIQALEEELGVPLFNRLGRQVTLTDAGERLLSYAERILDLAEEARAVVAGGDEPNGMISLAAPETVCTYRLPSVLRAFRDRCPQVRLSVRPMSYNELHRALKEGEIDVALLLEQPLRVPHLCVDATIREPLAVVAAGDHSLVAQSLVNPADLAGETLLLTERGCGYRVAFEQSLAAGGLHSPEKLEFNSIEAIKQCVIAGLGIAVLPAVAVARELERGELAQLNWFASDLCVHTQVARHRNRWLSPALSAFLDTAKAVFAQVQEPGVAALP